jgi:hypothetical protein
MSTVALHVETSRTRIGAQSAIGTAASTMKDLEILAGDPAAGLTQQTVDNPAQVRRRRNYKDKVSLTKKGSPLELEVAIKRLVTALTSAATPQAFNHADALSHQIVMRAALGAELTPAAGSTVAGSSGTPVNVVTVASGHGTRFTVGSIIIVVGEGPRRVTAISSDDLTLSPPLSGAPSVGTVVRNCYCYYTGESDSTVYTVQHVPVEGGTPVAEHQMIGAHFSPEFTLEVDNLARLKLGGACLDWTGPGDLSIGDAPAADDMGSPLAWNPTFWLESSFATLPSPADEVGSVKLAIPRKWQMVQGSTINGVGSVHEVAGRGEPIDMDVEGLYDPDWWTRRAASTNLSFVGFTSDGTGSSSRYFGFWCPTVKVIEQPTRGALDALLSSKAKLRAMQATDIVAETAALSTAQIQTANIVFFLG